MTDSALASVQIDREAILRHLGMNPRDPAVQALVLTCERYGLDPLLKHALLIEGRLYVTRDGLLHVAHRSGALDGVEVIDQHDDETHWIATVSVYRKDMAHPFTFVGRFPKQRRVKRGGSWVTEAHPYGPEMAVKTAECMALRRAFDVALAAREEMWDADDTNESSGAGIGPSATASAGAPALAPGESTDAPPSHESEARPKVSQRRNSRTNEPASPDTSAPPSSGADRQASAPERTGEGRDGAGAAPLDEMAFDDLLVRAVEIVGKLSNVVAVVRAEIDPSVKSERDLEHGHLVALIEKKAAA